MPGQLIVIEGLDGSGKATQSKLLFEYFQELGKPVRKVSFPNYESDSSALVKMYLSGQFGRSIRYYKKYCTDWRFMSTKSLIKTGDIVGVDFCYHELPDKLDPYDNEAFKRSDTEFYAGCTNIETGEAEYVRITDMNAQIDYVRASATLPFVSRIVDIDGKKYLDGGCTDSIPFEAFAEMGFTKRVLILTRPSDHVRKPEHPILTKLKYRKYPKLIETMARRHTVYNETLSYIEKKERERELLVIRPEHKLPVSRVEKDPEKLREAYEIGRKTALKELDKIKKFLSCQKETV